MDSMEGFTLTSLGLQADSSPTLEEWQRAGDILARGNGTLQWAIGDWLLYGEERRDWGDGYKDAIVRFGRKYQTLLNLKSVAKAFPFSRRRENLSWAHHAEVVGLSLEDQVRLLDEAGPHEGQEKPRLTRSELRERVKQIEEADDAPIPFVALMHKLRSAVEWATENCRPEDVLNLQSYVERLSGEVPELAEPIHDVDEAVPHVARNSGNNEWYTPEAIVEAVRQTLGGIDLDPASSDKANAVVRSDAIYTALDDGLIQPWSGRVFLNPPYSSDLVGRFVAKLVEHVRSGDVSAAVVLVNNATETAWFGDLVEIASAVVFPRGRIRFWRPAGTLGAPLQGQAIVYIGEAPDGFLAAFSEIGWGALLVRSAAESSVTHPLCA